ncbi:MAG: hypothetical protein WCA77_01990 [Thermoplasmata archaeon]
MRPPGSVRPARLIITFWVGVIAVLLFVEVAELTHLFTLPLQSAVVNLVSFIFAIVFITILALVGSLFAGFYISQRLLSPQGFTPFEEEMLKMRVDVKTLRDEVTELRRATFPSELPSELREGGK